MTNEIKPLVPVSDKGLEDTARALLKGVQPSPIQSEPQEKTQNKNGFIYVPNIKLWVAEERTHLGKNWAACHNELQKQESIMLTPFQFREFLKILRYSQDQKHQKIYRDITEVRDPWRAEWLDAYFENRKAGFLQSKKMYILTENKTKAEKLEDYLHTNKTPGISLDGWLNSTTKHGLPPANISDGELYYWAPTNGYVARFNADSGRADLDCGGGPTYSYSSLGVRVARKKL